MNDASKLIDPALAKYERDTKRLQRFFTFFVIFVFPLGWVFTYLCEHLGETAQAVVGLLLSTAIFALCQFQVLVPIILARTGHAGLAKSYAERILRLSNSTGWNRGAMHAVLINEYASMAHASGDFTLAENWFREAIETVEAYRAFLRQGKITGNQEFVASHLRQCDLTEADSYYGLADTFLQEGRPTDGISACGKAMKLLDGIGAKDSRNLITEMPPQSLDPHVNVMMSLASRLDYSTDSASDSRRASKRLSSCQNLMSSLKAKQNHVE